MIRWFLFIILSLTTSAQAFETSAKQAMLYDATTRTVLFAKNAQKQMGPSSMSKIMTVYLTLERIKSGELSIDDTFYVSEKAWRKGGSKMFVRVGDRVPVRDLLHGVIVQSGNDACIVLAEGLAGSEQAFALAMNAKAKELGLKNSHFVNATGWPDPEHYMTAEDLVILSEALIRDFPEYYNLWAQTEFTYAGIRQFNRNTMLGEMGVDGLKSGHTEAAGYGIVMSAEQKGRRLISVVNGLESKKERIEASRQLLTYGFTQFSPVRLFSEPKHITDVPVWYGSRSEIPLVAAKSLLTTLPKFDKSQVRLTAKYQKPVIAPVKKGQILGYLTLNIPNAKPIEVPLLAAADVQKTSAMGRILPTLRYRLFGAP